MMYRQDFHIPCLALLCLGATVVAAVRRPSPLPILEYISRTWVVLIRSHQNLAAAAMDPKTRLGTSGKWPVYVGPREDVERLTRKLSLQMKPADYRKIALRLLPSSPAEIREHGLLYLPLPYVVPGGRFNEMYGWDSYFIQMGLLRDNEVVLAKDMADNFIYEIREYGKILNANRTYYLTRSQPPFFTAMLLAVYRRTHDRAWLNRSFDAVEQYYRFWTSEPHLTPQTGLSRYYDTGEGPAPEVVASEVDRRGRTDYDLIREYYRNHKIEDYDVKRYYDAANDQLTPLFYKNDRAMRESGFDPSNRFGPFGAETINYNPVCLNSLLYLMEIQAAEIMDILDRAEEATKWRERAGARAGKVNRLMWDEHLGLYVDYDWVHRRTRNYPFLTTFYPLWTGIASKEQAARVVGNVALFERPGGLQTSTHQSGDQWDAPFGWAPLQWIAVEGLRRYGYRAEADRISMRFLTMVREVYRQNGTIVEKYDVVRRRADISGELQFGYSTNEAGFGWTNAVFTALLDRLPQKERHEVLGVVSGGL